MQIGFPRFCERALSQLPCCCDMLPIEVHCYAVQRLGFSDTLGAFAAGVLLSETNFRTQVGLTSNAPQPASAA